MANKRFGLLFCFTLFPILLMACSSETMEDVMREAESTDLSDESIDGIKVGMNIHDESFIMKHGNFQLHPDNQHYAAQRNYDQYWNKEIMVSVNRETEEILQVGIMENNNTSSSERGIKRGSSVNELIETYGENYFTYEDKEQSISIIGYVDHPNNLQLTFVYFDDQITGVNLGYAFDKMKWELNE
ncbi:hypothetical protein [Ornithinibacillus sp. JPR2-1]|uniref:hypothetical protein n=1 Tax=Ornithinibacillus sp. JPR2-1 TaxID=2094019 RepID=UPI0031DB39D5